MQWVITNKTIEHEPWWYYLPLSIIALIGWITLLIIVVLVLIWPKASMPRVCLPFASECVEDKEPPNDRLIISIFHSMPVGEDCLQLQYRKHGELIQPCRISEHWKITIQGKGISKEPLKEILKKDGDRDRPGGPKTFSARPIMIKADASTPYSLVKYVLQSAAKAGIWKIELSAAKPYE